MIEKTNFFEVILTATQKNNLNYSNMFDLLLKYFEIIREKPNNVQFNSFDKKFTKSFSLNRKNNTEKINYFLNNGSFTNISICSKINIGENFYEVDNTISYFQMQYDNFTIRISHNLSKSCLDKMALFRKIILLFNDYFNVNCANAFILDSKFSPEWFIAGIMVENADSEKSKFNSNYQKIIRNLDIRNTPVFRFLSTFNAIKYDINLYKKICNILGSENVSEYMGYIIFNFNENIRIDNLMDEDVYIRLYSVLKKENLIKDFTTI